METAAKTKDKPFYSVKSNSVLNAAIKDVDTVGRVVTGFFNAYNYFDDANDVLLLGSCKKSIKEHGPNSNGIAKIKHAINHDLNPLMLPGKIVTLEEKEIDGITGLYFETKMANTQLGNDTLINYLEKVYDNHSIGYRLIDYTYVERENEKAWKKAVDQLVNPDDTIGENIIFLIKEIQLYEGSTVSFGCNELTPFLGIKSNNPEVFKLSVLNKVEALEKTLRSGTQSDEMMETIAIQLLQIKQIFGDLVKMIPEVEKPKPDAVKGLNMDALLNSFSLSK